MPENLIEFAAKYADGPGRIREVGDKNRAPFIDEANRYVGNPLGSPYCVAAWCLAQSQFYAAIHKGDAKKAEIELRKLIAKGKALPISGGSQYMKSWAKQKKRFTADPQKLLGFSGAFAGWTNEGGQTGHFMAITQRLTDASGKIAAIRTLEFNTDPTSGDSDGEGCYRLRRTVPIDRGHELWFIDATDLIGGNWWSKPQE